MLTTVLGCSKEEGYNLDEAEVSHLNTCLPLLATLKTSVSAAQRIAAAIVQVKQAIKLLDKNNDSLIQFGEFVDWWQNEVGVSRVLLSLLWRTEVGVSRVVLSLLHEWQRIGDQGR